MMPEADSESTRRAIAQWISAQEQKVRASVSSFRDGQLAAEREIASLRTKTTSGGNEQALLAQEISRKKFRGTCLEEENASLAAKENLYPELLAKLKTALMEKKSEMQQRTEQAQKRMMSTQHNEHHLSRGAELFKSLGIEFKRIGNERLRVVFTQIDAAEPSREFSFVVFVDTNDVYHVSDVQPPVKDIDGLLVELNNTNDFSRFVRNIRKQFQSLTCS